MSTYKLVHEFGNVICSGTYAQCQFALRAIVTYGVSEDKFKIVPIYFSEEDV